MENAKMNNNKREQERNELYRTIWTLANELRVALMAGILNNMFQVCCFIDIYLKILQVT